MIEVQIMTDTPRYISLGEVGEELQVNRASVYYYIKHLEIDVKKFPLDRKKYILISDLEKIKAARKAAAEGRH
jgi:predicted DNA-binding protein YlxM (UPF0122 family)